ncbi:hypothetical protein M407DRAFT_28361 [Tulasnella calospora MUT 4182]|uniref:F-box domain-containing protein n=1 Tax=Tulasnella calospora MUT 4182 TaxID=1051891 RepID=A0A0C3QAU4_9AGAM|nr:hypothetical protein M407DRAFT_28361 [Tulasnella calospora MUT 4182]
MPLIQELPIELLTYALTLGLTVHPCPSHILCVCKTWEAIATPILHKNIRFTRFSQLKALTSCSYTKRRSLPAPYSIAFTETADSNTYDFFRTIESVFQSINLKNLEVVRLNVHSYDGEGNVFEAFKLIDPLVFEWLSPDVEHQVSTSITGTAARSLVLACYSIFDAFDGAVQPNLSQIEIAQAVHVEPLNIVSALARLPNLAEVRLADVYMGSIWEKRLRMEDLRKALEARDQDPSLRKENEKELTWNAVMQKVKCVAQKQRLQGGDRGEDMEVD